MIQMWQNLRDRWQSLFSWREVFSKIEIQYRIYLKQKYNQGKPRGYPKAPWTNTTLKSRLEYTAAIKQAKRLRLCLHCDPYKNWDNLASLDYIIHNTSTQAHILDAGAESYSVLLPWLFLYDYQNLLAINPVFTQKKRLGLIEYEPGDITRTRFHKNTFDVITCLSVIEHGVDMRQYFAETARILKPGGVVITSCDYYQSLIDTHNQMAFGVPVHIFHKDEILAALCIAEEYGLFLTAPIHLNCHEKPVKWEKDLKTPLDFTFLIFVLQKSQEVLEN